MQEYRNEKDWKLFKSKFPVWQECCIARLNKEYIEILSGESRPSEKFWSLDERIRQDKRRFAVGLRLSRSMLIPNIAVLIRNEVISFDELGDFSEELKERIRFVLGLNDINEQL